MRAAFLFSIVFFLQTICTRSFSQGYTDTLYTLAKLEKATSFASFTYGGDVLVLTGGNTNINSQPHDLTHQFMPRLTIGGLHFWNHADFYVTFPLGFSLGKTPSFTKSYSQIESVETGFKIYPWAAKPERVVPYVGISFQPLLFKYELKGSDYKYGGANFERFVTPVQVGLSYVNNNTIMSLSARYNWKNKFDYYTSPTELATTEINAFNVGFAFLKYIDSDKNLATEKAADRLNRSYHLLDKIEALSSWYWAIGPSTALQMSKSPYYKKYHPYFYTEMSNSFIVPEVAIGKYFHKKDFNINAAFRYMWWKQDAFETEVKTNRLSMAIESYKFLFDYHGFVPFVGPTVNFDRINFNENGNSISQNKINVGVVFGWDIRVIKTGSSLLRTNLRYIPNHHIKVKGEKVMFDHLEFNFIQYVKFFGRNKKVKNHILNNQ